MNKVNFDLHLLGWKAFEDLVACVFRDIFGQTLQVFAEGPDGGRDAAFSGVWTDNEAKTFAGSFAIQCKHTSKAAKPLPSTVADDELKKSDTPCSTWSCRQLCIGNQPHAVRRCSRRS